MKVIDDDFAFINKPKESTKVEDDEINDHLEMLAKKKKQAEVEQFMLAIDQMRQGEKGLYTPLSSKFKKLAILSRLVFAMTGTDQNEEGDGDEFQEEKRCEEENIGESNKKEELPPNFCALDLAKTFEYWQQMTKN